jgi:hypothetical protein
MVLVPAPPPMWACLRRRSDLDKHTHISTSNINSNDSSSNNDLLDKVQEDLW